MDGVEDPRLVVRALPSFPRGTQGAQPEPVTARSLRSRVASWPAIGWPHVGFNALPAPPETIGRYFPGRGIVESPVRPIVREGYGPQSGPLGEGGQMSRLRTWVVSGSSLFSILALLVGAGSHWKPW